MRPRIGSLASILNDTQVDAKVGQNEILKRLSNSPEIERCVEDGDAVMQDSTPAAVRQDSTLIPPIL